MIVEIIHIVSIAFHKAENHSPVSPHSYRPEALELAFKRMEPEPGQVHIRNVCRYIEPHQNIAQFFGVLAYDAALVVIFIKAS